VTPLLPLQAASTGNAVGDFLVRYLGTDPSYAGPIGKAITFVVVAAVVYYLGKALLLPLTGRLMDRQGLDAHAKQPIRKLLVILLAFAAVGFAFAFAGFGNILTAFATIGAAATLAVGFAMKDVIANFVAGIFIYTDHPFRIGDWIEWDDNAGIVEDISLRVTRVRTFDNELLTVPNSVLNSAQIINHSAPVTKTRVKVPVGVAYGSDLDVVEECLLGAAEAVEDVASNPTPRVRFRGFGDSSLDYELLVWVHHPLQDSKTVHALNHAIHDRFVAAGVEVPFPQRDLHVRTTSSERASAGVAVAEFESDGGDDVGRGDPV